MRTSMRTVSVPALMRVCYVGTFVFGTVFSMLGTILPELLRGRDLNVAQAGELFFFLNLGSVTAVMTSGLVVDWIGYKSTLVASPLVIALSYLWIGSAG